MQANEMVEKKRSIIDGEEIAGLVYAGELVLEKGSVEIPEFRKIRTVQNGITKYPPYELKYKLNRGTNTKNFFQDWYSGDEIKDVTIIRTDAHGVEFERVLLSQCECLKIQLMPESDLASPAYAQMSVTILPWEITPIDAV